MKSRSNLDKVVNYVRDLQPGSHGVFFYRNPGEKREVLFNYLEAGMQKGEGAIYVASQEPSNRIRSHMEDFGFNIKSLERDGVLKIHDADGWYVVDGEVDVSHALRMGYNVRENAMEIGLKGVRACGEAACFFAHGKERELVDYELTIGRTLDASATALCAYDVKHATGLEEKLLFGLVKAHGPVVTSTSAQEVAFENLFPAAMDNVLESLFGEIGKEMILMLLDKRHSLKPEERERRMAEDPMSFVKRLEELVGSGAIVIKQSVANELLGKIGLT